MPTATFGDTTRDATLLGNMVNADDGYIIATGPYPGTYPPTGTPIIDTSAFNIVVQRYRSANQYGVSNGLIKWNTSSLPDNAVITAATLRIYVTSKSNVDALSLVADWYTWSGVTGDYTATPQSNAYGGIALSSITASADNSLTLINMAANVSRTGYTYLRLHLSDSGAPSGTNQVVIASVADITNPEPRLDVVYTLGGGDLLGMVGV